MLSFTAPCTIFRMLLKFETRPIAWARSQRVPSTARRWLTAILMMLTIVSFMLGFTYDTQLLYSMLTLTLTLTALHVNALYCNILEFMHHFLSTVKTDASSFLHCPSLSADLREAQHACRGIAFTQRSKMAFLFNLAWELADCGLLPRM